MTSLIDSYRVAYPGFIEYLEANNLDAREMGFTCLVSLGIRNKAIGNFLSTVRHNQISVVIRNKLKIETSRINVGIQELLKRFDPQNKNKDDEDQRQSQDENLKS